MRSRKAITAAVVLSTMAVATPAFADGWFYGQQEPAAFQAMYPNRDVLNGGALTPAGRLGLVRAGGAAPVFSPTAALPARALAHHHRQRR